MLDSDYGIDLISLSDLSRDKRDLVVQNAKISLRSANGKMNAKGVAPMLIEGLEELVEAIVLESTPSWLSKISDIRSSDIDLFGSLSMIPYSSTRKGND